jgi:hypothetical protein
MQVVAVAASGRASRPESEAEIATSSPTYWSLCEEVTDDNLGWMGFWFDEVVGRYRA